MLPQDGIIDITADITSGAYGIGSFVLDAVQGEKVTYTVGGRYTVYTHPKAGGKAPEYTPDEYQQLVSQVKNAIPPGGTTGQVLAKKSDADRDFAWEDQSGGEQVNPDWNQNDETAPDFVKNRPFYTGDPVITELIPEQTVAFSVSGSAGQALSPVNVDLVEGQTYTVEFDGETYECVCNFNLEQNYLYIGNDYLFTGKDSGEPFLYGLFGEEYGWISYDTKSEHTLSLCTNERKIVQIPEKYLPIKKEVLMVSDVSLWTDEQKQKYYDAYLSGTVLFHKSVNADQTGIVLALFYSKTVGLNMSLIDDGGWLHVYKGEEWISKDLLKL